MPFYGLYFDSSLLILLPGIILAACAQWQVSSTYQHYSRTLSANGWTAAAMVRRILDNNGLNNVQIVQTRGNLTDHYDPSKNVLALSESVYGYSSLAALGVAAHEVGHALQHAQGYTPIKWRSSLVPVTNLGSALSWPLLLAGLIFAFSPLIQIGIILFSVVVVFQLITLPVEFNASSRALILLEDGGFLQREEISGARAVLRAAALTYVASALTALLQLLRLLALSRSRD
jgi:Zn-dependent membrane protease YugP